MKTIEMTLTVSGCLGCEFCPQQKLGRAYTDAKKKMSWGDFSAILEKLSLDTQIHFSGYSESLLHPLAPDFIAESVWRGFQTHWYTTLVPLSVLGARKLSGLKLEYIRIHVPDRKAFTYDDHKWIAHHELFLSAKLPATYMAMDELTPKVKAYLDALGIKVELPTMLSRAGNLWDRPKIEGHIHCAMNRWHSNTILPNGDAYLCCMDFGLTAPVGNLLTQSYAEIHETGERFRKQPPKICQSCEWAVKT